MTKIWIDCDEVISETIDEILKRWIFKDKNIIYDANIGHVKPIFTIINGSFAIVEYKNNKMILKEELLDENNG